MKGTWALGFKELIQFWCIHSIPFWNKSLARAYYVPEAVTLSNISTLHFSSYPQNEYVITALRSSYKNLMASGMERPWLTLEILTK